MKAQKGSGGLKEIRFSHRGSSDPGGARHCVGTGTLRGHAMVMAVVFVFFLVIFGMGFYRLAETDIDLIGNDRATMEALYAAQAGMKKAAWIVKHHRTIEEANSLTPLNPFSTAFYDSDGPLLQDFQQIAQDNQDLLSPGGNTYDRYFTINWVDARGLTEEKQRLMGKVRVQVLGALDVDGDGLPGLTDMDADNFPIDRGDVNRKFEAVIGLPGSLADGLSAGTPSFTYGAPLTPITFWENNEQLVTQDGYNVPQESGFLYDNMGVIGSWDQYNYIFGKPLVQAEIELPPGLFDVLGRPVLPYFSDLNPRVHGSDQVFDRDNDPTEGFTGRDVIYVYGDVTIQDVDFGYLDSNGVLRGSDWEETDVTIVSTGTLTVKNIQCGDVGRLTLIAQNILLVGDYDTRINGIALASGTITLDDRVNPADPPGCEWKILKDGASPSEPLRDSAYFMGTILAGTGINLRNAGWTVLHDVRVINGLMYDPTVSKPTQVYERAENENGDFPYPKWQDFGGELKVEQGLYSPGEIIGGVAASWDLGGGDGLPNVMEIDQIARWRPSGSDDHDFGVSDEVELDFLDTALELEDWRDYRVLSFWMSLDNFRMGETVQMFYFRVRLEDAAHNRAYPDPSTDGFNLSEGPNLYDSLEIPGDEAWKKVGIPLAGFVPTRSFDIKSVNEIRFYLYDLLLSWQDSAGRTQWIDFDPDVTTGYGSDGRYVFHLGYTDPYGRTDYSVRFWRESLIRHRLYYTDAGGDPHGTTWDPDHDHTIRWVPAGNPAVTEPLYFEDHLKPNMRVDHIHVPGRPASNAFLEYGLPRAFRYAVTHLTEHKTF